MLLPAKYAAPVARLAFLTIAGLSAFLLTARYKLSLPDDYPYGTPTRIGKQAVSIIEYPGYANGS
jgi:hypothetical protein